MFYIIVLLASSMTSIKLELTKKLNDLAREGKLDGSVAILNLPGEFHCEKIEEIRQTPGGLWVQSCKDCVAEKEIPKRRLPSGKLNEIIDHFSANYGTKFIAIPGRGNPLHPKVREETLEKIRYASTKGLQSYIFSASNGLTEDICRTLAEKGTNVMMSLRGNPFIDSAFFSGKQYPSSTGNKQNEARIAERFRRLIKAYQESPNQPEPGTTRLAMNYVVTETDLTDNGKKIKDLRQATSDNGILLVTNSEFDIYTNKRMSPETKERILSLTSPHSTTVNGQCRMGARSSLTIDSDGTVLPCPYFPNWRGYGNVLTPDGKLNIELLNRILPYNSGKACILRESPVRLENKP